jgi:hypothetical protein
MSRHRPSTEEKRANRAALVRGVLNGMAAPAMLFAPSARVVALELDVSAAPVVQTPASLRDRGDWDRIGVAIQGALSAHGR